MAEEIDETTSNRRTQQPLPLQLLPILILYSLLLLTSPLPAASDSASEAAALLRWDSTLNDLRQSNISTWPVNATRAAATPCRFVRVSCTAAGSVLRLNLTNSGLNGTLEDFPFSSLPSLSYFELSINQLYGIIPPAIGQLANLIYFDVSLNQLSGVIPPEIGLLRKLETLHIINGRSGRPQDERPPALDANAD